MNAEAAVDGIPMAERGRSISDMVAAHLAAANAANSLNGFSVRDDDVAVEQAGTLDSHAELHAESAVRGWVGVVKDNIHVAGLPNSAGSPALRTLIPDLDSPVVATLRAAGAIFVGKANMHELALGMTSNNAIYGPVRNPFDPSRTSGGSSGGTATVVASGAARFGLGTDTGGSVRVPAAFTGLFGLRPTTGRYSGDGVTPLSASRDTIGLMTRTAEDLDLLDLVITGANSSRAAVSLAGLVLGIPESVDVLPLTDDVRNVWESAVATLKRAGVRFVRIDISDMESLDAEHGLPLVFAEAYPALEEYLNEYAPEIGLDDLLGALGMPDVKETLMQNRPRDEVERVHIELRARAARKEARALAAAMFARSGITAMIMPTVPTTAPLVGDEDESLELGGEQVASFPALIRNAAVGSFIGLPGTTFPAGASSAGLPVGISLDAPEGTDRELLALTSAVSELFSVGGPLKA
ncbi:amidase family protein [Microbacterium saperdae]